MISKKIGIVGLGKLGLPMLAAFVDRGFDPSGYDLNLDLISSLKAGKNVLNEPGLSDVIKNDENWKDRFYDDLQEFSNNANIFFFIVPTPTLDEKFNVKLLLEAMNSLAKILHDKQSDAIFVITSTVNPGDCSRMNNLLKAFGSNINLVYSPEFIALGSVFEDMLNPDIVLLGGEDDSSLDTVFSIYSKLYKSHPEFHRLSFLEAETAKIAINTFVTTKISFANMIGEFIESKTSSRVSSQRVLNAIGGDSRIGRKYFKYGGSYGGPCFPRDNRALAFHLKEANVNADIPYATDKVNRFVLDSWFTRLRNKHIDAIILGGLAYKKGTDFTEESFIIKLGEKLMETHSVFFVDPLIENYKDFKKITEGNIDSIQKNYKTICFLNNYYLPDFIDKKRIQVIEIWN